MTWGNTKRSPCELRIDGVPNDVSPSEVWKMLKKVIIVDRDRLEYRILAVGMYRIVGVGKRKRVI